jgi:hypothetical protein
MTQLHALKPEPVSPPLNRGCGGGIVIRERRGPSPLRGHDHLVCVKREPEEGGHGGGSLRRLKKEVAPVTSPDAEDNAIIEAVMARSLNDVFPANLKMLMDTTLASPRHNGRRRSRRASSGCSIRPLGTASSSLRTVRMTGSTVASSSTCRGPRRRQQSPAASVTAEGRRRFRQQQRLHSVLLY